jgi:hypothetical protein
LSQTSAGGEVVVLDSGSYDPFGITQPVSIIAPAGVHAGITVTQGNGITINTGPSDTVVLRGLTMNNQGGANGIVFYGGLILHVENCIINGFSTGDGIDFSSYGNGDLEVKDSIVRNSGIGIAVQPRIGFATAVIDHTRLEGGGTGLLAYDLSTVTARDSIATGFTNGFEVYSGTSNKADLHLDNCLAANNSGGSGLLVQSDSSGTAEATVHGSAATGNAYGFLAKSTNTGGVARLNIAKSTASGNTTGIFAWSLSAGPTDVNIDECIISHNNAGVVTETDAGSPCYARVSGSMVTDNYFGFINHGGATAFIYSRVNNTVEGNKIQQQGLVSTYQAK